ncbi:integumentary mucin C.1-like [Bactrocera tryoni]|uniref:integumentary mucin C.1-like n=1 Tax=Bactrocera tryoni TaxID=59916 RepID=UPI001A96F252|nr:integumentary mucin C.1-like [Bactrocera tryoni]
MCVNTIMLSSSKSSVCLLLLLAITELLSLGAAMKMRHIHETTTIATEIETLLPTTTTTTPATTTKTTTITTTQKSLQSSPPSQHNIEDYGKSVKIIFPTNDDSEDNRIFDVYGLKTTPPPPNQEVVKTEDKMNATEATIITTTKSTTDGGDSVSNSTIKSVEDRIGVLNLAPHCPEGTVIVNQRCHKSA